MKLLVTGKSGQVGWELGRALAPLGELISCDRSTLDLAIPDQIVSVVRAAKPDVIVNAAAYTAVDRAESERDLAHAVNARAPGILAEEAKRSGAFLIHYSTDYVFDGTKQDPYVETDTPRPLNVYGETKLAGERAVEQTGARHLVLRTSWVYSARGHNFLLTMLRLAREKPELSIVHDQLGAPTSARAIADATARILSMLLERHPAAEPGLYHLSAAGRTSWHGFAREIFTAAGVPVALRAIPSAMYRAAATRPKNSLLDNGKFWRAFGFRLPDWKVDLHDCIQELIG